MAKVDLNKLMDEPRAGMTLDQVASEINALVGCEESVQLAIGRRLIIAEKLISRARLNLGLERWCAANIRKKDGSPYSWHTLYTYLVLTKAHDGGRYTLQDRSSAVSDYQKEIKRPGRLLRDMGRRTRNEHLKALIKAGATQKAAGKKVGLSQTVVHNILAGVHSTPVVSVSDEVALLMTAWEAASQQARNQFLHAINARYLPGAEGIFKARGR